MNDKTRRLWILGMALAVLACMALTGTAYAQSKCDAGKLKEYGKRLNCMAKVDAKAAQKAIPVDSAKAQKCIDKFDKQCARAEERGDCTPALKGCAQLITEADTCQLAPLAPVTTTSTTSTTVTTTTLPGTCDTGDCPTCQQCALEGPEGQCEEALGDCEAEVECVELNHCLGQCGSDELCASVCVLDSPSGAPLYQALVDCVDAACPTTCGCAPVCGDGVCESECGEIPLDCPTDCGSSVGCNNDGICSTLDDDCVCVDCRADAFCSDPSRCTDDEVCDPYNEGCQCTDCAAHPECVGGPTTTTTTTLPGTCDTGDCPTCQQCSVDPGGPCDSASFNCGSEPECVDFLNCVNLCAGNTVCFDDCVATYPTGASLYDQLVICIGNACPGTCGGS